MKKLTAALAACLAMAFAQAETLTISVWSQVSSDSSSRQRAFFDELSKRTGIEFNLVNLPLARATVELKNGKIDGEFLRTRSVYSDTDDVIHTAEPLGFVPFYVFTDDGAIDPAKPETFRDKRIVLVQGSVVIEDWARQIRITDIVTVLDFNKAFQMILSNRADFTVSSVGALPVIQGNATFESIAMLTPPVFQDGLYLFLGKQHRDIMPAIDAALRDLAAEGFTAKMIRLY